MEQEEVECEFNRIKEFKSQFTGDDIYHHCRIPVTLDRKLRKRLTVDSKRAFYARVLIRYMDIVIKDLIDKGNKYEIMPNSFMFVESMSPTQTATKFQNGGYRAVDPFASDFTLYQIVIKTPSIKYYCKIDQERYTRICDNVNKGRRYATYSNR